MAFAANWRASSGSCAALQLYTCMEYVLNPGGAWVAPEELRRATSLSCLAVQHSTD